MKFVDEGTKLRTRRLAKSLNSIASSKSQKVEAENSVPFDATSNLALYNNRNDDSCFELMPQAHDLCDIRLSPLESPRAEYSQLVSCFVSAMFPLGVTSVQTSLLGSWLWHIPPRLGSHSALDYAATSVALAYFGRVSGNGFALKSAESSYMVALRSLAIVLDNKSKQFDSEVLCATLLLGHYEVCSGFALSTVRTFAHNSLVIWWYKPCMGMACWRSCAIDAASWCAAPLRICV